jgi:hypothetical protein
MARDGGKAGGSATDAGESVAEALERARLHGRRAAAEAVAALRALIDAATLAVEGSAGRDSRLAALTESLDRLRDWLDGESPPGSILETVDQVLAEEIARWEERSRREPDARAVLRAFLAVREVIFELRTAQRRPTPAPAAAAPRPRTRRRAQRVPVEG